MEVKIIPTGGLCNRLRAIATGVAMQKEISLSFCHLLEQQPRLKS